jgi:hypothetical protein
LAASSLSDEAHNWGFFGHLLAHDGTQASDPRWSGAMNDFHELLEIEKRRLVEQLAIPEGEFIVLFAAAVLMLGLVWGRMADILDFL